MTLQAKLTLYYVLLAVLMAGIISGVDLVNEMQAAVRRHAGTRQDAAKRWPWSSSGRP